MLFVKGRSEKLHPLIIIGLIPLTLNVIIQLRVLSDVLNPWIFGLLPMPFIFDDLSVYELFSK
jgi:hypothetical protein